jgi:hypothetical protein
MTVIFSKFSRSLSHILSRCFLIILIFYCEDVDVFLILLDRLFYQEVVQSL